MCYNIVMTRSEEEKKDVGKSEKVEVRLTAEEKLYFLAAAERLDMTISDFVRFLCLPYARDVAESGTVTSFKENISGTAAGTADYFAARFQASEYKPSSPYSSPIEQPGTLKAPAGKRNEDES